MGHGSPLPGPSGCWSLRSTTSGGSPWSGQQLQGPVRPPAVCLHGGTAQRPPVRPHRGPWFQEACAAWPAEAPWPGTCSWGWRCRGWCQCRCRWSHPWRGGLALAPRGPGGPTSGRRCGCWMRCWRACCCWSDWSTEAPPGRREKPVIPDSTARARTSPPGVLPTPKLWIPHFLAMVPWVSDIALPCFSFHMCKAGWLITLPYRSAQRDTHYECKVPP